MKPPAHGPVPVDGLHEHRAVVHHQGIGEDVGILGDASGVSRVDGFRGKTS
jgi:hypothetical protein